MQFEDILGQEISYSLKRLCYTVQQVVSMCLIILPCCTVLNDTISAID